MQETILNNSFVPIIQISFCHFSGKLLKYTIYDTALENNVATFLNKKVSTYVCLDRCPSHVIPSAICPTHLAPKKYPLKILSKVSSLSLSLFFHPPILRKNFANMQYCIGEKRTFAQSTHDPNWQSCKILSIKHSSEV